MRLIDQETGARTRPMKVLVLGMPRTGTVSMFTALTKLGYKPYHMVEVIKEPNRIPLLWNEALDAKFFNDGSLKPFGREEFDKLLGDFDAVSDAPCCLFPDELIAAYPDSKIILTKRSPDSWVASIGNTVGVVFGWKTLPYLAPFDGAFFRSFYPFAKRVTYAVCRDDFGDIARQVYLDHNTHVRKVAPKGRLLEFEAKDGWEPLCNFLGHGVPNEPYPRTNDSAGFVSMHAMLYYMAAARAALKLSVVIAPIAFGVWYARSRR